MGKICKRDLDQLYVLWAIFPPKTYQVFFTTGSVRKKLISKTNSRPDRSIPALSFGYQEYLVTSKSMTSQVVQRA